MSAYDVATRIRFAGVWLKRNGARLGGNAIAGLVASLLTIAYCLSFSALLFQGELKSGLALGLWGLLVGSAIAGIYISLTTTLPPVEAGPDNPAVAVLSVLAGTVSAEVARSGGNAALAIDMVLLSFSLATLVTGIVLYAIGVLKLGQVVRFVPYPVIGGFLAASGWFLIAGGLGVVTGQDFDLSNLSSAIPAPARPQVFLAMAFALTVYALKFKTGSSYVLPLAFLGGSVLLNLMLAARGLDQDTANWFIAGSSTPEPWLPLRTVRQSGIDWRIFWTAAPEIAAAAGVTVIALLLDVSGLEVARGKTANLDHEFRTNGAANIIAAPLGGIMGNLSMNGSRLLDESGGLARISGVIASLAVAMIVITGLDLTKIVPAPVLAGLLIYLGMVVLFDVLLRSPAHRAWTDYALALLIMAAIVHSGYLAGVFLGIVGACLMFALSYSRIAVVRRHLTRAVYASNVDRAPETARRLVRDGERIHIFWLSGFIFFGSSNAVVERIRLELAAKHDRVRRYAVLDFSDVSGFDTSALLSLAKLKTDADEFAVTFVFAALSPALEGALRHVGVLQDGAPHRAFHTRNAAVEWCEDEVLAGGPDNADTSGPEDFESWLAAELGGPGKARTILHYFERRTLADGTLLYAQGAPADTIDFVVSGSVAVTMRGEGSIAHTIRRMAKKTVVGEMGFFRAAPRTASIAADGPAVVYTLSRAKFQQLLDSEPRIGADFLQFIIRALADRLEFANSGLAAMT